MQVIQTYISCSSGEVLGSFLASWKVQNFVVNTQPDKHDSNAKTQKKDFIAEFQYLSAKQQNILQVDKFEQFLWWPGESESTLSYHQRT